MAEIHSFRTIEKPSEALYKEKGSKFISYLFKVNNTDELADCFAELKSKHPKARHLCYAYRIGATSIQERANDDGEPSGSAGLPILNQLKSAEITNVLCVVVRYFGGTKLGVSGLIKAYKIATQEAIAVNKIINVEIPAFVKIVVSHEQLNFIYRQLKVLNGKIEQEKYSDTIELKIQLPKSNLTQFVQSLEGKKGISVI